MKRLGLKIAVAALLMSASVIMPATAGGLFGGGDGGGLNVGGLVSIGGGNAGDDSLINVGLGGGDNILDANVAPQAGGGSLLGANVGTGGDGLLNVGADVLGGTLTANIGVGGDNLLDVDIGVGGPGRPGTPGTPGTPGRPGTPGTPGGNGNNGNNGGFGGGFATNAAACRGIDPMQMVRLFEGTSFSGWNRASNIQIVPVRFCPEVRQQFTNYLAANGKYTQIQSAVSQDALISAALNRTNYNQRGVFAVDRNGQQLVVYVY